MRTSDDGEPLVHRVRTQRESDLEAKQGLDVLLEKVRVNQSRDARERAARATADELEAIQQRRLRMAQIQAERFEWRPVGSVVLFERQVCENCLGMSHVFRGFSTLMERKADAIRRMVQAPCIDFGLPVTQEFLPATVPVCFACVDRMIFNGSLPEAQHEFIPNGRPADA